MTSLPRQKQNLSDQQQAAQNLLSIKMLQQNQLTGSVNDQSTLLQQTKGREADYQATLSDTQAQAAAIRSQALPTAWRIVPNYFWPGFANRPVGARRHRN